MPKIRIAVIGSGIAGLSAAYWLSQEPDIDVTLLEKLDRVGMDAYRLDLQHLNESHSVDVPSRMFNSLQWPSLVKLYDELGVAYEPVDATQSFSHYSIQNNVANETFLRLNVAFRPEQAIRQLVGGRSRKLLAEAARLMKEGCDDLDNGIDPAITLGHYLNQNSYSASFRDEFLFPTLSSTVCTCSFASLDNYPASTVLSALRRLTDDRALMRTSGGTQDAVDRLTAPRIKFQTSFTASSIVADSHRVQVRTGDGLADEFDHVIMATQANTALKLLPTIKPYESDLLKAIPYDDVPVVVHRDDRLMPSRESDWCTFNMGASDCDGQAAAMCSVWLNRFHHWKNVPDHFQTIMPLIQPDPSTVLAEIQLQRPIVNARSVRAIASLDQVHRQPGRRIWYCGSWAAEGIPLLESGVVSAQRVVKSILASRNRAPIPIDK